MSGMGRREFITLLGGAAAWPIAARAQPAAMPVIGFLNSTSPGSHAPMVAAFRHGLKETGYVEGRNLSIEYRWAEGQYDRLPALAADLIRRQVSVLAATSSPAALAVPVTKIPIVFTTGNDPVKLGLVSSLNRPGGNVTGSTFFNNTLGPKRLQILREVAPNADVIAVLVNPRNQNTESDTVQMQFAARSLGVQLVLVPASNERDLDAAFARLAEQRVAALVVNSDPFFYSQRGLLTVLAARHALPAIYEVREFTAAGGLMSYGTSLPDAYRQAGVYVGRILRGESAGDLPIHQPVKFEFAINMKTAKALGLNVPNSMQLLADEVIE
jgi:putative tryptophan/tyrosine transport system substrate-binding protein